MTYIVHGGHVRSRHDGDVHYISPSKTAELYGLDPVTSIYSYGYESLRGYDRDFLEGAVHLYPDSSGKYELPVPQSVIKEKEVGDGR